MTIEDHEPQIESLSARFEASEIAVAYILARIGPNPTNSALTAAQVAVARELTALLSDVGRWIEANVPRIYRDGAKQAVRDMALRLPRGVFEERLRAPGHVQSLQSLAEGLLEDMAAATQNMSRDAKKTLREIGRRQLAKSLAKVNPVSRVPDFRAELEEQGIAFVDRAGRRWSPKVYARTVLLTQTGMILNAGSLNTAIEFGSPGVRVSDGGPGDVDEPCVVANGQRWSILYAMAHPLEHPNCRRSFAALSPSWRGKLDRVMEGESEVTTA